MNVKDCTPQQQQALLDLLVLGMYADGHLTLVEDAGLKRLLASMGYENVYDRNRQLDASITRVSQYAQEVESATAHAARLAQSFKTPEERQQVCNLLDDLLASDNKVVPSEGQFQQAVKEAIRV